jgi:hypothetical protein
VVTAVDSRDAEWAVEPDSEGACEDRRNVCVDPFVRLCLKSSLASGTAGTNGGIAAAAGVRRSGRNVVGSCSDTEQCTIVVRDMHAHYKMKDLTRTSRRRFLHALSRHYLLPRPTRKKQGPLRSRRWWLSRGEIWRRLVWWRQARAGRKMSSLQLEAK